VNKIEPIFAVPIVEARFEDCMELNRQLESLFIARAGAGERFRNSQPILEHNSALFESSFDLFDWPDVCVQRLRIFCLSVLYGAIGELNGYGKEMLERMHIECESWYHLTQRHGYFGVHIHALHAWSGVYCVRHDGDAPQSNSGRLTFVNPHITSTMYLDPSISNLKLPFGQGPRSLRLIPGQLVIFPSWLMHYVLPYEGNGHRITVAFNAPDFRGFDLMGGGCS
jgi:hypothetical protein